MYFIQYVYGGAKRPPYRYDKIHCTDCVDVVKLSVTLIGLTIRQMLCLISGTSGKHLPEVTTSGKAANSLLLSSCCRTKIACEKVNAHAAGFLIYF